MEMVRITNTQARLLHLPSKIEIIETPDTQSGATDIKFIGSGTGKALIPGGNNVPKDYWDWAQKNATIQTFIKKGWLTVGGDTKVPEGPPVRSDLLKLNETASSAMVEGEDDRDTLLKWFKAENRPRIQELLANKLDITVEKKAPEVYGKKKSKKE